MRYIAYSTADGPMIGVVTGDPGAETVQDLMGVDLFYADPVAAASTEPHGQAFPLTSATQIPPVPTTAKILCVGLNYPLHIEETKSERPVAPNLFARWYSQLNVHEGSMRVPTSEPGLDWEAELGVIIGTQMTDTAAADAMAGVFAYTCFNDVSARGFQRRTKQWALGKNADGSGPIGPVAVTADEFGDPYSKRMQCRHNGETRQDATIGEMIFKIDEIIEYATQAVTLNPGDVIATGTPSGVGSRMEPPILMHPGDTVEVDIEGIGILRNTVV